MLAKELFKYNTYKSNSGFICWHPPLVKPTAQNNKNQTRLQFSAPIEVLDLSSMLFALSYTAMGHTLVKINNYLHWVSALKTGIRLWGGIIEKKLRSWVYCPIRMM